MIKKGTRVRVLAQVCTGYAAPTLSELWPSVKEMPEVEVVHDPDATKWPNSYDRKKLFRVETNPPLIGIVIGKTKRQTGWYDDKQYDSEYRRPSLMVDKTHVLWLVEPCLITDWYREPILVLETDLTPIEKDTDQ